MTTKISRVRDLMASGDEIGALRIVARFGRLGADAETIRRGWNAWTSPAFYRELGLDPTALVRAAIAAIRARYGLA